MNDSINVSEWQASWRDKHVVIDLLDEETNDRALPSFPKWLPPGHDVHAKPHARALPFFPKWLPPGHDVHAKPQTVKEKDVVNKGHPVKPKEKKQVKYGR